MEALFNQARDTMNAGDARSAIAQLDQAIAANQDHFPSHYLKGMCYGYLKDYEGMKRAFTEAVRIEPADADALYFLGNAHYKLKAYEQAIKCYQQCEPQELKHNPRTELLYFHWGLSMKSLLEQQEEAVWESGEDLDKQLYHSALKALMKCLEIQPNYLNAYYEVAMLYHHNLDQPEDAKHFYQEVIDIAPDQAKVPFVSNSYAGLAVCEVALDNFDASIAAMKEAIALDNKNRFAFKGNVDILLKRKAHPEFDAQLIPLLGE